MAEQETPWVSVWIIALAVMVIMWVVAANVQATQELIECQERPDYVIADPNIATGLECSAP